MVENERQRLSRCGSEGVDWLARPSHLITRSLGRLRDGLADQTRGVGTVEHRAE